MKNKGFTLIELLVVISIISLLSSVVMASVARAREKAQVSILVQSALSLRTAIESYSLSHEGKYPSFEDSGELQSQTIGTSIGNIQNMPFIQALVASSELSSNFKLYNGSLGDIDIVYRVFDGIDYYDYIGGGNNMILCGGEVPVHYYLQMYPRGFSLSSLGVNLPEYRNWIDVNEDRIVDPGETTTDSIQKCIAG